MKREAAEALGLRVLVWLAADADLTGRFLAETGAGPAELRARARDPDLLGFVLDFLMSDEAALVACAEALATPPDAIARARAGLPGGDLPHWT